MNRITISLLVGIAVTQFGCAEEGEPTSEASEAQTRRSTAELTTGVNFVPPRFFGVETQVPFDICHLRSNATDLVDGEIVSVSDTISPGRGCDPAQYTHAAPYRTVKIDASVGEVEIVFLERHFTHRLTVGDRLVVATRTSRGQTFEMGYVFVDPPIGTGNHRADVSLPDEIPSLRTAFAAATCDEYWMDDTRFEEFVYVPRQLECGPASTAPPDAEPGEVTDDDLP